MGKPRGGLTAWFGKGPKGDWVNIGAPKKDGKFQPCVEKLQKKVNIQNVSQEPQPIECQQLKLEVL